MGELVDVSYVSIVDDGRQPSLQRFTIFPIGFSPYPNNAAGTDSTHAPARPLPESKRSLSLSETTRSRKRHARTPLPKSPNFWGREKQRRWSVFRREGNRGKRKDERPLLRIRHEMAGRGGGVLQIPGVGQTVSRTNDSTNRQSLESGAVFAPSFGREKEQKIRGAR